MRGASVILLLFATTAFAGVRDALRDGNDLYRAGAYEDALVEYENAGDDALALFNRACALQRLGRADEAQELLRRVDAMTQRDDLAASARYNLGSASVDQARTLAGEGSADEALDAYRRAARLFRDAYALDPKDTDAARNIEVAGREAKALLDQIRQQQQAMQQMQEQLEDLQEQQEQEAQQSDSQAQNGEGADQQQQQRQQSLTEQTEAARDQMRRMQDQMEQSRQGSTGVDKEDALERAAQRLDQAVEDQQRAEEHLEQNDAQGASESQRDAAEQLQRALDEMSGQPDTEPETTDDERQNDNGESSEGDTDQQGADDADTQRDKDEQSESEGSDEQGEGQSGSSAQQDGGSGAAGDEESDPLEKLAQDLLEKEQNDRERLKQIRAQRRAASAPVEKDW